MTSLKQILTLLMCLAVSAGHAEEPKYELSKPVNLRRVGVNKVLYMRNGNTMLFHFEPSRGITVKVFDNTRKEIASHKELCRILDVYLVQEAALKGMYDINGEAVLFFDQDLKGKHSLIRLRFSATNGELIEEKLVAESKSENKRIRFYIMKKKGADDYAILFSTSKNYPKECDIYVVYFDGRHEVTREVQLDVDRKKYDYLEVVGAEYLNDGPIVALGLSKLLQNGTLSHGKTYDPGNNTFDLINPLAGNTAYLGDPQSFGGNYDENDPTPSIYEHYLGIYYLPAAGGPVRTKLADLSTGVYPYHANFTNNSYARSINLLLLGYQDAFIHFGLELQPAAVIDNVLLKLDEDNLQTNFKVINHQLANKYLKQKTDTNHSFMGLPLATNTNENGLSTMVSEYFYRYRNVETSARPDVFETYLGNIAVTQFDDEGKEIWGIVLPRSQYYMSYRHYYYIDRLSQRWNDQVLIDDLPAQVYNRQFVSANVCDKGNNCYIIYNDDARNFNNNITQAGDTVYNFEYTNACYYKIDNKKEVTKHYLFGAPQRGEFKCGFIEGSSYDEQTGTYAVLVQYRKGGNTSLRMAWAQL